MSKWRTFNKWQAKTIYYMQHNGLALQQQICIKVNEVIKTARNIFANMYSIYTFPLSTSLPVHFSACHATSLPSFD
jgi:hypothetical protein